MIFREPELKAFEEEEEEWDDFDPEAEKEAEERYSNIASKAEYDYRLKNLKEAKRRYSPSQ